jgi:hypothetical protein
MHVAALGFGPQALLMPMEGVTLAANAVLAPVILGEEISARGMWGTGIVICGIAITVIFGPHSSITYTASEMVQMLSQVPFLLWSMFVMGFSTLVFSAILVVKARNKEAGIVMTGQLNVPGAHVICFGSVWIAGVFSSATMLTAKQTMELLETTLMGNNQFTTMIPFIILINFILMNFLMEYWKQKALAVFNALIVVPIFQVCLVVLSVVGGAIYFDEFKGMPLYRTLLFMVGLLVVCGGIVVLSTSTKPPKEHPGRTMFAMTLAVMTAQRLLRRARKRLLQNMEIAAEGVGGDEVGDDSNSPSVMRLSPSRVEWTESPRAGRLSPMINPPTPGAYPCIDGLRKRDSPDSTSEEEDMTYSPLLSSKQGSDRGKGLGAMASDANSLIGGIPSAAGDEALPKSRGMLSNTPMGSIQAGDSQVAERPGKPLASMESPLAELRLARNLPHMPQQKLPLPSVDGV